MRAGLKETVYGPDNSFSSKNNGPDSDESTETPTNPSAFSSSSSSSDLTYSVSVPSRIIGGTVKVTSSSAEKNDTVTVTVTHQQMVKFLYRYCTMMGLWQR